MIIPRADAPTYGRHLLALAPTGPLWPRDPESVFARLLEAFGQGLSEVHNRLLDLIEEADPRTTYYLLEDWERVLGLPDPCAGQADTIAERRARIVAKLTATGGQSREYFITLARILGFEITITEQRARYHGRRCHGTAYGAEVMQTIWQVNLPPELVRRRCHGQGYHGEPFASWGAQALRCMLNRLKPAHTTIWYEG